MLEVAGFEIVQMKVLNLTKKLAERFYEIHKRKDFFHELVDYMRSDKILAICVEKENCVIDLRKLVGDTDPEKAKRGTIRKAIGKNKQENGVHASDSPENAEREIRFFFSALEVML